MSDVAQVMGVSPGTLYNYVQSKEALFFLLLEHGLAPEPPDLPETLPVVDPPREELFSRLAEQVETHNQMPRLWAALDTPEVDDAVAELRDITAELYDLNAANRRWIDLLERSSEDLPEVARLFLVDVRQVLFDQLTRYFRQRMERHQLAALVTPVMAGRYVVELITTFTRRLPHDPDPKALPLTPEAVRDSVVDLVGATFTPRT